MLLLLFLLFAHIALGSCMTMPEDLCYGTTYTLPMYFSPILYNKTITYNPKVGEPKIVVKHRQSLDPRFEVTRQIEMTHISERDDDATLSFEDSLFKAVRLRVKNCRSVVKKLCGEGLYWVIPHDAEYLEFSGPDVKSPPVILWNRTSRSSTRGRVFGSNYEITDLTQKDSGYYRFRNAQDQLRKWEEVLVEGYVRSYEFDEGEIKIKYPTEFTPAKVSFMHTGAYGKRTISEKDDRFTITKQYLAISYATPEDSGTYDLLDKDGNRILQFTLEVKEVEKVWVSVVILAAISCGFVLCCCCLKKHCCNESSDKTNAPESETEAASPSVYNHGTQTTEPVTPLLSREPRVIYPDPPTYSEAGGHADPPPPYEECAALHPAPSAPAVPVPAYSGQTDTPVPAEPTLSSSEQTNIDVANDAVMTDVSPPGQVSAAEATGATAFDVNTFSLTTDSDPHFELRSTVLPSAPPLNSDGSDSAQYNSDKFNFL